MSEATRKRNSHRSTNPVDAAPRLTPNRNLADSPRRRARLKEVEKLVQEEKLANSGITVPETQTTTPTVRITSETVPEVSPEAADLFTKWLHENGFRDFASFQDMTRQAESERHRHSQGEKPVIASRERPPTIRPKTSERLRIVDSPVTMPAAKESPATDSARISVSDVTDSGVSAKPVLSHAPVTTASHSSTPLRTTPTTRLEVSRRRKTRRAQKSYSSRYSRRQSQNLALPRPLSKTRKVPILLTLGVLLFLIVATTIPVLWYQTRVAISNPEQVQIEVLGAVGAQPVLTLSGPLPLEQASTELLHRGEGNRVEDGKTIALRITVFSGTDGKLLSASGDESVLVGKLSPEMLGTEIYHTVRHATEGSRYILKHPVKTKGTSHMEIGVIDVIRTSLQGPMTVSASETGGVTVTEVEGAPTPQITQEFSGDFQVDSLIEGRGAPVSAGQSVLVKYREYSYSEPPALLKDHWKEPVKLKLDDSLQMGVIRGIIDQKIGSRLLVQVPPAQGAGSRATILIVDVLASWDPSHPKPADSL